MSNGREYEKPCMYQLLVKGTLTPEWANWFEGFNLSPQEGNETLLTGQVMDQSALHGMLAKIAHLGIPLLSVTRLEVEQEAIESTRRKNGENRDEYNH